MVLRSLFIVDERIYTCNNLPFDIIRSLILLKVKLKEYGGDSFEVADNG